MRTWILSSPHKPAGILPRTAPVLGRSNNGSSTGVGMFHAVGQAHAAAPVLGRSNNRNSTGVGMFHIVGQAHAAAPEDGRAPGNRETSAAPLTS